MQSLHCSAHSLDHMLITTYKSYKLKVITEVQRKLKCSRRLRRSLSGARPIGQASAPNNENLLRMTGALAHIIAAEKHNRQTHNEATSMAIALIIKNRSWHARRTRPS